MHMAHFQVNSTDSHVELITMSHTAAKLTFSFQQSQTICSLLDHNSEIVNLYIGGMMRNVMHIFCSAKHVQPDVTEARLHDKTYKI